MNLPVHPTQVNTQFFVQNPPHQFPNFPELAVPPIIHQNNLTGFVLGMAAMFIQQGAGQNAARTFFANLVSRDNWQNREAAQLVGTVFEHVEFALATAGRQANVEQVIEHMVGLTVQQMVAVNVANYQEGMAQFIPPTMGDQLNNVLDGFSKLRQDVENFQRQANNPPANNYGGGGYGGGGGGGGFQNRPVYPGAGVATGVGRMPRVNPPARNTTAPHNTPRVGYGGGFRGSNTPAPSTRLTTRFIGTGPAVETPAPVRERVVEISGGPNRATTQRKEPVAVPVQSNAIVVNGRVIPPAPGTRPAPAPEPEVRRNTQGYTITDENDPYSEIVWDNGAVLRYAAKSGWERTRTDKNPYNIAYNPNTHVLFHLRSADGVVQEILQEKTEVMEQYLDHEQDPDLRAAEALRVSAKKGKSAVDWSIMTNLTPAAGKPYSIKAEPAPAVEAEGDTPPEGVESEVAEGTIADAPLHRIDTVISAHDVRSAETVVMVAHPEVQEILKTQTVEFYCEAVTLRLSTVDLSDAIEELANCRSFEELTEKLAKSRAQWPNDGEVWDEIDRRLTAALNSTINIGFGINWTVGLFSEDALSLAAEIYNTYGQDVADAFDHTVMYVIDRGLCTSGPGVEDRIAADSPDPAAMEAAVQNVVSFADRCSVTKIPYTFEDLNVKFEGTAIVERTTLPDLHAMITAIFSRTENFPVAFKHRLIKTSDGVWLSLDIACLNEGAYLISRHTF